MSRSTAPCPCGLPIAYADCCGRYHAGRAAPTAEALMRSRYSAFVLGDEAYLLRSWHSRTRPARVEFERGMRWTGLEILETSEGGVPHATGTVTFRARYRFRGQPGEMWERSRFTRENGEWRYLDGEISPDS